MLNSVSTPSAGSIAGGKKTLLGCKYNVRYFFAKIMHVLFV